MSSTMMMQSMCNNHNNDLGLYGAQFNSVNYGSAFNAPVGSDFISGGPMYFNATLPMPQQMTYPGGLSPQMVPMRMPAISAPPVMPMMEINSLPSVSPPPLAPQGYLPSASPMSMAPGFLPPVPMMGYSVIPVTQNGMQVVGYPTSASASPENQLGYVLPEIALTPPHGCSISRSCSPANDRVQLSQQIQEVSRERLPTCGSSSSVGSATGQISKKELVENCLNRIDQIFGNRVQTTGMRGPTVMRIKVKTRPALELIVQLLETLEQNCTITAISCPKSTKKGKQHIRGFLAYIQTSSVANISHVQRVFNEFNQKHTSGEDAPFKTLEINPQKKN